jgi:hypothetical protein
VRDQRVPGAEIDDPGVQQNHRRAVPFVDDEEPAARHVDQALHAHLR